MPCGDDRSSDPSRGLLFLGRMGTYPVEGDVPRGRGRIPWKGTGSVEKGTRPHVENILKKPLYFARVNIYDYKYYGLFITFEIRGYYGCAGSKGFRTEGANFI